MRDEARSHWLLSMRFAFLVFLYGPVLLMPLFSFNDSTFATFPLKGFTLAPLSRDGPRTPA